MTSAKYETAPCPPGAICTPRGNDHIVSYAFKVDRESATRRPFVVHGDVGGVDICLDVMVELEIRTRMSHHGGGSHVPTKAQVSLHPRIDFESCGTYFRTDTWLGPRAGLRARQKALHELHDEILRSFGGQAKLESWKDLDDAPANVTVLGAAVQDVRKYVNKKLAELGDGGHDGHGGRGRRKRSRTFVLTPLERSRNRSSVRKKSAKRRGSAARAAPRRR